MPNQKIPGCGFHHVALRTHNWLATMTFYAALGFEPKITWGEAPNRAIMLDTGDGNYLEVFEREAAEVPSEATLLHLCFRAADVDAATELARAAGAQITTEPTDVTIRGTLEVPLRLSFCKGPNGEIIEFFQNEML